MEKCGITVETHWHAEVADEGSLWQLHLEEDLAGGVSIVHGCRGHDSASETRPHRAVHYKTVDLHLRRNEARMRTGYYRSWSKVMCVDTSSLNVSQQNPFKALRLSEGVNLGLLSNHTHTKHTQKHTQNQLTLPFKVTASYESIFLVNNLSIHVLCFYLHPFISQCLVSYS